jgi:agmatinase
MPETNSPEEAEVLIQKLPCDMGIHRNPRKGTLDAPQKVLERFEPESKVLVDEVFPDEFDLEETHRRIEENTEDMLKYGRPIISIGGDHSVSFPVIKAVKQRFPDLQLVWLDAHLDMKEKVDGHVSHDVVVRELLENTAFTEEDIWIVGVTRIDEDEEEFLENKDLKIYRSTELGQFREDFSKNSPVYLSVDIDVLREELAPGTGYPDGELDVEQVGRVIEAVEPEFANLVEVAPSLDEKGRTVRNAREILEKVQDILS